jgi:putative membrane protein
MVQTMADEPQNDPRVYFAAERTLLAWLRTGLALMGVGFAVARFGLFLRQMQASQVHGPVHSSGVSVWSGVALVTLGVVVNLGAMMRHVRLTRELISGTWRPGVATQGVALAVILAVLGLAMAVYLILMR